MTPKELLKKADRAIASAQALLSLNDSEGACNRAYYAMFDAARAALLLADPSITLEKIRTHKGLIAAFGLQIVKPGLIPTELGKTLNKTEELRLLADYTGDLIEQKQATWAVEQASIFIEAVKKL